MEITVYFIVCKVYCRSKKVAKDRNVSLSFSEMKKPNETQNAPSCYGVMNM